MMSHLLGLIKAQGPQEDAVDQGLKRDVDPLDGDLLYEEGLEVLEDLDPAHEEDLGRLDVDQDLREKDLDPLFGLQGCPGQDHRKEDEADLETINLQGKSQMAVVDVVDLEIADIVLN